MNSFVALAEALTDRCLADPVLNHPFAHGTDPAHNERLGAYLGAYLGEVFGGPPVYTQLGGHSVMLAMHAGKGADADFGWRFVACFDQAVEDAGFPKDADLRQVLHDYMICAANEVDDVSPMGATVRPGLAMPRWLWNGRSGAVDR